MGYDYVKGDLEKTADDDYHILEYPDKKYSLTTDAWIAENAA